MRVEYTGRHMDVPDKVRRLGERKLRKLAKHLRGITDVPFTSRPLLVASGS